MSTPLDTSTADPRHEATWSVEDLKWVDAICEDFERSWQTGEPLDIRPLIVDDLRRNRLLFRELLAIDLEYRARRNEAISEATLRNEYPEYADIVTLVCSETVPPSGSANDDVPEFLQKHPRYEITGQLGFGGMGTVFSGRHLVLGRDVAIKVIRRDLLSSPGARDRFLSEARTAARLQHPNVVAVYDAEATDRGQFLVMEAVSGSDLARTVAENGALPWEAACDAIYQAALGLEAAQKLGLVHRDLSPRNLMLADDGTVKLLDFGLASLNSSAGPREEWLAPGMLVGSAAFVAPEQIDDPNSCDVRSDLYSLGCVMYFLLTGQPPFVTTSLRQLLDAQRSQAVPDVRGLCADVPEEVAAIVARLVAKSPAERFQTPAQLADALAKYSATGPEPASVLPPQRLSTEPTRKTVRQRIIPASIALMMVALCGLLVYSWTPVTPKAPAAPAFVQGLSLLEQRQEQQVRLAISKFQQVLKQDPKNARAYAALAEAYNLCGDYGWETPDIAFPKAIEAAQRSLELDNHLAEGRLALAFAAATYECDWLKAEEQFRLTIAAAPKLASAHHWYAWFLLQQHRFDEALAEMETAQSLAPDNLIIVNNVGRLLYFSRRYKEAAERHRAAIELDQDFQKAHMDLGYTLIELGQLDEAISEFDLAVGMSSQGWELKAARAFALARKGNDADAQAILATLTPVAANRGLSLEMAQVYAALGDSDQAFNWLNTAFELKSPGRADVAVDPRLDPLRSDPRFPPLLKSIGLSDGQSKR